MPATTKLRLIPCARVSSDEQAENTSLETQIEATTTFIKSLGAVALAPITDDISGVTPFYLRPGGKKILALLESGQADGTVWVNVNRYFRDDLEGRLQARSWFRAGKRLFFCNKGEVTDDGEISFLLEGWQAREERKSIRDRTAGGRRRRTQEGRIVASSVPFWLKKNGDGGAVLKKSEARNVKRMHGWLLKGATSYGIAEKLNHQGIPSPTGRLWIQSTVQRILSNEALCGVLKYGKVEVSVIEGKRKYRKRATDDPNIFELVVPAVISRHDYLAGLAILTKNREDSERNLKRFYLLRGMVFCKSCDKKRRMTGEAHGDRWVYICPACRKSITGAPLEAWVWAEVDRLVGDEDAFEASLRQSFQEKMLEHAPRLEQLEEVDSLIAQTLREAEALAQQIGKLPGVVGKAIMDSALLVEERHTRLIARREELVQEMGDIPTDDDLEALLRYREQVADGLEMETDEERREYLSDLGLRVEINSDTIKMSLLALGQNTDLKRESLSGFVNTTTCNRR